MTWPCTSCAWLSRWTTNERALGFYRDVLGLPLVETWEDGDGSGVVLDAGRATPEVLSTSHADMVDRIARVRPA